MAAVFAEAVGKGEIVALGGFGGGAKELTEVSLLLAVPVADLREEDNTEDSRKESAEGGLPSPWVGSAEGSLVPDQSQRPYLRVLPLAIP